MAEFSLLLAQCADIKKAHIEELEAKSIDVLSDVRYKKNIENLSTDHTSKLMKMRPVCFDWKKNDDSSVGFIAQEIESIFPELVNTHQDGHKTVRYIEIIPLIVKTLQELNHKMSHVEEHKHTIDDLQQQISHTIHQYCRHEHEHRQHSSKKHHVKQNYYKNIIIIISIVIIKSIQASHQPQQGYAIPP